MTELQPDLYIASMGRSGSTLIANWLSVPALGQFVFVEPNLTQGVSALLITQMERFGLETSVVGGHTLASFAAAMAGKRWGIKEVKGELHRYVGDSIRPRRVVITVRDIEEVYLSLVEKHRVQGVEDRFDLAWSAGYCVRESAYLLELSLAHPDYHVVRYHEFVESPAARERLTAATGFVGGGIVDLNFDLFNRSHESGIYQGRIAARNRPYLTIRKDDARAAREVAARCAGYQEHFGYKH